MFYNSLPKWSKNGKAKEGTINWTESIGCKVKFIYDDIKGEVEIIDYKAKTHMLYIKYLNKKPYKIKTDNFQKCQIGELLNKRTGDFIYNIGDRFIDEKRDITIIDKKYIKDENQNKKYYRYHCNICNYNEGWMTESNITTKIGCSCCNGKTIVPGINDIPTTAPFMVQYFQGGYDEAKLYTKSSSHKIYPICPECGRIKTKKIEIYNIYMNHSIGCGCSDGQSYPFKILFNIFEQLKINFISEYAPKWIKPKRYDFYFKLNNKKYIVEMDGGLGHGNNNILNGQTKEESKAIDDYKDELAKEHNIEVIRIDCDYGNNERLEYIKNNILSSKLVNILFLNNISWMECEKFALSNLIKKACEIKRDNPNMTTTEIGTIMNLNRTTINNYLKKGLKIWNWCNYNPKEELIKSIANNGKKNGKPIEVFKDGKLLGVYPSACYVQDISEKEFGVKIFNGNISKVCNGERKHSQGYVFKYI